VLRKGGRKKVRKEAKISRKEGQGGYVKEGLQGRMEGMKGRKYVMEGTHTHTTHAYILTYTTPIHVKKERRKGREGRK
jgi:hypothetical protein